MATRLRKRSYSGSWYVYLVDETGAPIGRAIGWVDRSVYGTDGDGWDAFRSTGRVQGAYLGTFATRSRAVAEVEDWAT